jgi:hypothetical protein
MYVVLTGAKKNAGDFLITDRAESLLRKLRPDHDLIRIPGWEPLEPHLEQINKAAAVIILGGPGLQPQMYPKVYKLTRDLHAIRTPIILMGSGWKAFPGDQASLRTFKFSSSSLAALQKMSAGARFLSCRDLASVHVLRAHGIDNALMTGCPVWYDLESLGKPMKRASEINHIIFSPAQLTFYQKPTLAVAEALKTVFPRARLVCSFHRGIGQKDNFMTDDEVKNNQTIADAVARLGYEVVDVSGSADAGADYSQCDLHVGFRLHAHLYTLSKRAPSVLLHEDGRGVAASQTLNVRGFDAFHRTAIGSLALPSSRLTRAVERRLNGIVPSEDCAAQVRDYLEHLIQTRFAAYAGVGAVIDSHFEVMKQFTDSLP